jgi:hypothetical protein
MSNDEQIRVMETGDVLEIRGHSRKATTTPVTPLTGRASYGTMGRSAASAPSAERSPSMHYALLIALTWLCGPLALWLTPAGRRRRGLATLGITAAAAALLILIVPYGRFVPVIGPATPLVWSALALLAALGGFTVWAHAVALASASLPPLHRLPRLLRSRLAVVALGLLAPGAGMLASGGRQRAGVWLWLLWPAVLGLAVLRNATAMWQHLAVSLSDSAAADLLEFSLLLSAGAVVAGALVWLVQALEGARRLAPAPALSRSRGDWFAVALGVSCAALAVGGNPGHVARQLGDAALVLRVEGMTIIPLQLSLAADRLDPSCAEYAVQAIALHEARGDQARAGALRARLDQGLATYVALLGEDRDRPTIAPDLRSADPARPGGEEVYYGTLARTKR